MLELTSDFKPSPDQEQAIQGIVKSIKKGNKYQTLLGVTGSGKTFTMANVIKELNMPTLIMSHNKSLCAQLYSEFKGFFLRTMWNILFLIMIIISLKLIYRAPMFL